MSFLWGTSTSAHQIEGGNVHNDWWEFERARGLEPSGKACDFTRLFEQDLDRARGLGTNAFRFGLEWSRLEPRPGERDETAASYYERVLTACHARGLRPIVTLSHFTLPRWCSDRGGWLARETLEAFERHVAWVSDRFGEKVDTWVTVNEPNVLAGAGYLSGVFPPGKRLHPWLAEACLQALVQAHLRAFRVLHETLDRRFPGRATRVGASPHLIAWRRTAWDPLGLVRREGERFNWGFHDALARERPDFIGVNYFMGFRAHVLNALRFAGLLKRPVLPGTSDMGWPIDAIGFEELLVEAHRRYGLPVIVIENGIADATDALRPRFLESHVAALDRAVARGARVDGYCHWSLIDNFEWHEGKGPRFGLFEVDYATQERIERPSAEVYRRLIREHEEAACVNATS